MERSSASEFLSSFGVRVGDAHDVARGAGDVGDDGGRALRTLGRLRLTDGRLIDDSIVGREKHWTESLRAVDWDGNGAIDLVYNTSGTGSVYLLRNVGFEDGLPVFAPPRQFCCYGEPLAFT